MAAISNDNWKQIAMQRAEGLTDIWDVFKAWMGRAAEIVLTLCMFAQLIGMLPGVSYPGPTNSIILGVELIMLDFGAFALAPLAEQARNIGQEDAAMKAEAMATWLIRLVMTTIIIVIVGQFSPIFGPGAQYVTGFVKYAEPVLILVRVGFIVKYIHVIHSLRGTTTLAIQPTQVPTHVAQDDQIAALQKTVDGLISQLEKVQSTQVVEAPTQSSIHAIQPVRIRSAGGQQSLTLLAQVASSTAVDDVPIEDETIVEADTAASEQVVYPVVSGVSAEKVRSIIDAHLSGTKWRMIPGNYSQTVKPVRDAWEALYPSTQNV